MSTTFNDVNVSLEMVRERLDYDPETGVFTWREFKGRKRIKPGAVAGAFKTLRDGSVYRHIRVNSFLVVAHRLAWLHYHGYHAPSVIDHIDRDGTNNAISNLRLATNLHNSWNRSVNKNNSTGIKGVTYLKRRSRWQAQICVNGRKIVLGSHKTAEEAGEAYIRAAREHFGEFSTRGVRG